MATDPNLGVDTNLGLSGAGSTTTPSNTYGMTNGLFNTSASNGNGGLGWGDLANLGAIGLSAYGALNNGPQSSQGSIANSSVPLDSEPAFNMSQQYLQNQRASEAATKNAINASNANAAKLGFGNSTAAIQAGNNIQGQASQALAQQNAAAALQSFQMQESAQQAQLARQEDQNKLNLAAYGAQQQNLGTVPIVGSVLKYFA